jgi:hypothetical protein
MTQENILPYPITCQSVNQTHPSDERTYGVKSLSMYVLSQDRNTGYVISITTHFTGIKYQKGSIHQACGKSFILLN